MFDWGRRWSALTQWIVGRSDRRKGLALRPRKRRLSALTIKVLLFNLGAFVLFLFGVYWLQTIRVSLVEERLRALRVQAEIVAAAIAKFGAVGDIESFTATDIDLEKTETVLKLLVGPTGMRARVFNRAGRPLQDTRYILQRNQVLAKELPPPGQVNMLEEVQKSLRSGLYALRPGKNLPPFVDDEPQQSGKKFEEVQQVLKNEPAGTAERINAEGNLIISVAVPITRLQFVMGVLMLSTEAGDIDDALRGEYLQMLIAAGAGSLLLFAASIFLLYHVTGPVQQLSEGAETVRRGGRVLQAIPNFGHRNDEVGDLSISLRTMTAAIYARMDAIEQFAADVAHEIKNPLTSVASAVETLQRTDDADKRKRLLGVIRDDVRRLDRLITGISDASRLDAELSRSKAQPVDLSDLILAMAQMFEDPDDIARPKIVLDLPEQHIVVRGLDGPIAQVFRNIIENAMSFSPKGSEIKITARSQSSSAIVHIDDQGPGIPDDNLDVIFRRFYTSRPTSHGFGKNSGLGLSISRQIIDVHNGRLKASNLRDESGRVLGARFTIELPLMPSD